MTKSQGSRWSSTDGFEPSSFGGATPAARQITNANTPQNLAIRNCQTKGGTRLANALKICQFATREIRLSESPRFRARSVSSSRSDKSGSRTSRGSQSHHRAMRSSESRPRSSRLTASMRWDWSILASIKRSSDKRPASALIASSALRNSLSRHEATVSSSLRASRALTARTSVRMSSPSNSALQVPLRSAALNLRSISLTSNNSNLISLRGMRSPPNTRAHIKARMAVCTNRPVLATIAATSRFALAHSGRKEASCVHASECHIERPQRHLRLRSTKILIANLEPVLLAVNQDFQNHRFSCAGQSKHSLSAWLRSDVSFRALRPVSRGWRRALVQARQLEQCGKQRMRCARSSFRFCLFRHRYSPNNYINCKHWFEAVNFFLGALRMLAHKECC